MFLIHKDQVYAQSPKPSAAVLKTLTIEELMDIEVISVSKIPEKLSETASAIQVITQHDIRRSAASNVPEALRLVPNLQVNQLDSRHWIISARGFNSTFSNKLLVMIDGRTVYSPLFAGVFWDAQQVMLEDIDRIEVISGPGGTLWGANAVNGVINIITKTANETQGLYASAGGGSFLKRSVEMRYGGRVTPGFSYRIYAQHYDRGPTFLLNESSSEDNWRFSQTGFALDWAPAGNNTLTWNGNFQKGYEYDQERPSSVDGQNLMGKWKHRFSDRSNLIVQAYWDRSWRRDVRGTINDELGTYDIDIQHHFSPALRHNIIWGTGYRFMNDKTQNATSFVGFLPADRKMHLFSAFIQDEITLDPEVFKLTLGTKLQHNSFSGFEWQPSARAAYTPFRLHTLWAAVSRAIRAPSRIDVDYHIPAYPVPPTEPSVAGGPNFTSEKAVVYELGYRMQPSSDMSLSIAAFYSRYDDLHSVVASPGTLTNHIENGAAGYSRGFEFAGKYFLSAAWQLRGGYTHFYKKLHNKPWNTTDPATLSNLGSDAENLAVFQSILNLPGNFQLDLTARYTGSLAATQFNTRVPSYFAVDTRIAWQKKKLEISASGQNLLKKRHLEVGNGMVIPRSIYGKISWRY